MQPDAFLQALKSIATTLQGAQPSATVSSVANAGSGGGNIYSVTIGGFKLAFGQTVAMSGTTQVTVGVNLPAGMFRAVYASACNANEVTVDANIHAWIDNATAADARAGLNLSLSRYNANASSSNRLSWWAFGV